MIEKLYEDNSYLIVNKPAGLIVHSDGKNKEISLSDWFVKEYPQAKDVGEDIKLSNGQTIKKPGVVHRLDKETSGVIVLAKTQDAYLFLKEQFKNRKVKKTYRTFVYGEVKNNFGTIDRPIGRSSKDFRLRSAQRGARGKMREAVTEYKVLNRGKDATELELYPKTGRTHQIRVHLKAINHPIICDKLYAPKRGCILGFNKLALLAKSIEFEGLDGKKIKVKVSCPSDFKKARNVIK